MTRWDLSNRWSFTTVCICAAHIWTVFQPTKPGKVSVQDRTPNTGFAASIRINEWNFSRHWKQYAGFAVSFCWPPSPEGCFPLNARRACIREPLFRDKRTRKVGEKWQANHHRALSRSPGAIFLGLLHATVFPCHLSGHFSHRSRSFRVNLFLNIVGILPSVTARFTLHEFSRQGRMWLERKCIYQRPVKTLSDSFRNGKIAIFVTIQTWSASCIQIFFILLH